MYEAFYGLRERPFNLTPDPKYLYLSEKHKEAFAHLLYGITNRSGFVMITGEIGTGKTTLCRNLLNQMDSDTEVAFIFNPFLNSIELTKKINQEFGVKSHGETLLELTESLNVHLLNSAAHGKRCVLVIDEAQNLSPQVLEQIRLLSNIETDSEKLLQIILIGQPELAEKLQLRELRQLNQRITARYHLKPLSSLETLQYIAYRVHVAGGRKRINFTKRAVKQVYKLSGGVPRMINALCDRALLVGYTRDERVISPRLVRQAMKEIRGEKIKAPKPSRRFTLKRLLPAPSVAALLIMVLVLSHYLLDPVDRFARELRLFNSILSGDMTAAEHRPDERHSPLITAERIEAATTLDSQEQTQNGALHLVMELLNRSGSVRPSQLLAPVLADLNPEAALHAGIDALTSLWNRALVEQYPESHAAESLIAFFETQGLDCEHLFPMLSQLYNMNLPGLARMRLGNNDFWVGVLRVDDGTVTLLAEANKRVTVSHEEFNLYYGQELLAPWQDPAPNAPVLIAGQRGPRVLALKEQLRTLGLLSHDNKNDVYDRETQAVILALQEESGLNPDGKAGRQVRMALASLEGRTPALRRGGNQTAMKKEVVQKGLAAGAKDDLKSVTTSAEPERRLADAPSPAVSTPAVETRKQDAEQFEPIENTVPLAVSEEEAPVLAATGPEPKTDAADSDAALQDANQTPDFFERLRHRLEPNDNASSSEDTPGQENGVMMQVRELPAPSVSEPGHPREELYNTVTPPVLGSMPLVPHGDAALQ